MSIFNFLNNGNSSQLNLDKIKFISPDHIRHENGKHISGPHQGGARRGIEIIKNPKEKGYLITIHNLDGSHPYWGNNIQMSTKQMEVVESFPEKTILRGWGEDIFGNSFNDYGLSIFHKNNQIESVVLHLHDRLVDIEYKNSI